MDTVGQIYEIITSNLFPANIEDSNERMECARMIADLIGRNPTWEAPRNGVLLYFKKGNGFADLVVKTDPPSLGVSHILQELADSLKKLSTE